MAGIITDIKRFAVHDGPGIRTTVFFKGCPLRCAWCHNPECIGAAPETVEATMMLDGRTFTRERAIGYEASSGELLAELMKEYPFMEESGGGVTFSGGEPLMQHAFLKEMLELCYAHGIHTAVDTSLFTEWSRIAELLPLVGMFLVDLKVMDDGLHRLHTGISNGRILENLRMLSESGACIRVRIPVIPGVNDSERNVRETISFLDSLPNPVEQVDLLPFHNIAKEKYRRLGQDNAFGDMPSMEKAELAWLAELFREAGFAVTIGG